MFKIRAKLKRKSRLQSIKELRAIRDGILNSTDENQCVSLIKKFFPYQNNSISYGGQFGRYWSAVNAEYRKFSGWGDSELDALKMVGLHIYKARANYFLKDSPVRNLRTPKFARDLIVDAEEVKP